MPARLSSMELSPSSNPDVDSSAQPSRRKSGRVSRKPQVLAPTFNAKRKRTPESTEDVNGDVDMDSLSDESEDRDEDEPDEEERREAKRVKRWRPNAANKAKIAPKKPKANGAAGDLPIRTITSKPKKAKQPRKVTIAEAEDVGGLYGE